MVITNNGKPIALLTPLSGETLEETLSAVRSARAANALRKLRKTAQENGLDTMTEAEIQTEIDAVRRERS
jgi:antitoxin (DNA-binding transcriptional repressor) of toxin-antitoxin stability system